LISMPVNQLLEAEAYVPVLMAVVNFVAYDLA
jgi:hypothetical protein